MTVRPWLTKPPHEMNEGNIYRLNTDRGLIHEQTRARWADRDVLYLGIEVINREDGETIQNYRSLIDGQERRCDHSLLKFLDLVQEG